MVEPDLADPGTSCLVDGGERAQPEVAPLPQVAPGHLADLFPPGGLAAEDVARDLRVGEHLDVTVKVGGLPLAQDQPRGVQRDQVPTAGPVTHAAYRAGHGEGAPASRPSHVQRGMARPAGTAASGEG